jgi:hypothetical protein
VYSDNVTDSDKRELECVLAAGSRVSTAGAGGSLAATQNVRTDHEVTIRIQPFARPDKFVPPAWLAVPGQMTPGNVGITGESVTDENRVIFFGRQFSVGLVGDSHWTKSFTAFQEQFPGWFKQLRITGLNQSDGTEVILSDGKIQLILCHDFLLTVKCL